MANISATSTLRSVPASRLVFLRRLETRWGILFIMPWIIGFLLFSAFPMMASLYLSFTDYNLASKADVSPQWIGLANYSKMLSLDVRTMDGPDADSSKVL